MAVKHYVDGIPKSGTRTYKITTNGDTSTITDVTEYEQVGSNFGALDVNQTCVLECNYSKNGTVHALTTPNTASENIKFFATSAFTKGDKFTFNGVTVAAQTMDGGALTNNFFKANTIVECVRRGNVLYFGSSGGSVVDDVTGDVYRLGFDNGKMFIEEA